MERTSWQWGRKSSERSASGETESLGSFSSQSERFSDEQTLSNDNIQSAEITSKVKFGDEEQNYDLQTLPEKLSLALREIHEKEDLVKQHEKVAEEAVTGWERAENELLILKKRTDALAQKNSILEERVGHLDGALKECLRQLRQEREHREDQIYDAVAKNSNEWELTKSELENEIAELRSQLQNAKSEAIDSTIADVRSKLEEAERENSIVKFSMLSKAEELRLRTCERDLSTQAAESASKNYLDSMKKVAKLEAECHRLKAEARRATPANDDRSLSASSYYVKPQICSPSDGGEEVLAIEIGSSRTDEVRLMDGASCHCNSYGSILGGQTYNETAPGNLMIPPVEIELMDDFLEMEKIASQSKSQIASYFGTVFNDWEGRPDGLDSMITSVMELEGNIQKLESEKLNLEIALTQCQNQLMKSEDQLEQAEENLVGFRNLLAVANGEKRAAQREAGFSKEKLTNSKKLLDDTMADLSRVQMQLSDLNDTKSILTVELENANIKKSEAESKLRVTEQELEILQTSIFAMEKEINKERTISKEAVSKSKKLETEVSRMELELKFQRVAIAEEIRINQDKELAMATKKFSECRNTITSLDQQLKYLSTLDHFLFDSDKPVKIM